jgi:hypothetical protein
MRTADRRVHALAARAARAEDVDPEVLVLDLEVDFLSLWQHGNGRGGSMDASLRLGRGHPLHAVHAALATHLAESARPLDLEDRLLHAAQRRLRKREDLDLPSLPLDVARVHPPELAGEQGGFVPAGAGADFDDAVAVVERIAREQERLELFLQLRDAGSEPPLLGARLGRHLRIVNANELACLRKLVIVLPEQCTALDDLHQPLVLAAQRCHQPGVAKRLRVEQVPLDHRRASERVGEQIAEAQVAAAVAGAVAAAVGLAYFWRKRSTRPAVSTSFCLPVKNGWQLAQMSRWISCCVERVSNVFPHAQCTFAVA